MADRKEAGEVSDGSFYEIKVKDRLDEHWSEWLGGLAVAHDDQGNTLLAGIIPDQAALHGILTQIRDLGLTLISLTSRGIEEKAGIDDELTGSAAQKFR